MLSLISHNLSAPAPPIAEEQTTSEKQTLLLREYESALTTSDSEHVTTLRNRMITIKELIYSSWNILTATMKAAVEKETSLS